MMFIGYSTWTLLWRLGILLILTSIAGITPPDVAHTGAYIALVGAAGPFVLDILTTTYKVLFGGEP